MRKTRMGRQHALREKTRKIQEMARIRKKVQRRAARSSPPTTGAKDDAYKTLPELRAMMESGDAPLLRAQAESLFNRVGSPRERPVPRLNP